MLSSKCSSLFEVCCLWLVHCHSQCNGATLPGKERTCAQGLATLSQSKATEKGFLTNHFHSTTVTLLSFRDHGSQSLFFFSCSEFLSLKRVMYGNFRRKKKICQLERKSFTIDKRGKRHVIPSPMAFSPTSFQIQILQTKDFVFWLYSVLPALTYGFMVYLKQWDYPFPWYF